MLHLLTIVRREIDIHVARRGELVTVVLFYIMSASLFPIAIGNWPKDNLWMSPIVMWVSALLAIMYSQENLLREDFKLGVFDLIYLHDVPFGLIIFLKIFAHWLVFGVPIILATPFVAISFGLEWQAIVNITCSLALGSVFLCYIAAVGAALTVPFARGGTMVALLILPLYMPILCIGANLGILSVQGYTSVAHYALLLALTLVAITVVPVLVSIAIKVTLE